MQQAHLRFYAELNDFLEPDKRFRRVPFSFHVSGSVKDAIEALGVPHTEVEIILVNGESVGFERVLADGDEVSVYPMFEAIDVTPLLRVRPDPLRHVRFVLDIHLGRLASYLRMLGFDAMYGNTCADAELARVSREQRRILLTRDRGLLKRSEVTHGYYVRETSCREQLIEVLRRFDLYQDVAPFERCITCNGVLSPIANAEVAGRLEEETLRRYDEFRVCDSCGRVYWKGSHYRNMVRFIDSIIAMPEGRSEP